MQDPCFEVDCPARTKGVNACLAIKECPAILAWRARLGEEVEEKEGKKE